MVTTEKGEVACVSLLDLHVTDQFVVKKLTSDLANLALRFAISESKELLPPIPTRNPLGPCSIPHIYLSQYKLTDGVNGECFPSTAPENLFELFDKVCVIHEGQIAYFGPANQARQYFIDMG